jgi:hypothetical protein
MVMSNLAFANVYNGVILSPCFTILAYAPLVLFPTYSEHNPAKHLKQPKLVEFVSSKLIMHGNIFIPTLFIDTGGRCCN